MPVSGSSSAGNRTLTHCSCLNTQKRYGTQAGSKLSHQHGKATSGIAQIALNYSEIDNVVLGTQVSECLKHVLLLFLFCMDSVFLIAQHSGLSLVMLQETPT